MSACGFIVGCNQNPTSQKPDFPSMGCNVQRIVDEDYTDQGVNFSFETIPTKYLDLQKPYGLEDLQLAQGFPPIQFRVIQLDCLLGKIETKIGDEITTHETGNSHYLSFTVPSIDNKSELKVSCSFWGDVAAFEQNDERITNDFILYQIEPDGSLAPEKQIRGHDIVSTKKESSIAIAEELRRILSNANVINLGTGAMCHDPHHALRFGQGKTQTDVVICFECSNVKVYSDRPSEHLRWYAVRDEAPLKDFFRKYFPDDERLVVEKQ